MKHGKTEKSTAIAYNPKPDEVVATVWLNDGRDWEEWDGAIDKAGVVKYLTDTNGIQYHSKEALEAAGVKRFTLKPKHIAWVAE